jgi:hypothetical protein
VEFLFRCPPNIRIAESSIALPEFVDAEGREREPE